MNPEQKDNYRAVRRRFDLARACLDAPMWSEYLEPLLQSKMDGLADMILGDDSLSDGGREQLRHQWKALKDVLQTPMRDKAVAERELERYHDQYDDVMDLESED